MNRTEVFYSSDPLAKLLINKLGLTPIRVAVIIPVGALLVGVITDSINSALLSANQASLLRDWSYWVWSCFFTPVVVGYYVWVSSAIESLLRSIKESEVVEISGEEITSLAPLYRKVLWSYISLLLGVLIGALFYISRADVPSLSANFFSRMLGSISMCIGGYIISMTVINFVLNVYSLSKVLRDKKFNLNPLHPDKCGGLRVLSEYSLKTAYLASAFGIVIGMTEYRYITLGIIDKYWYLHLSIPVYIICATVCFLLPLNASHAGMKKSKEELLHNIAMQFQNDYFRTKDELKHNTAELKDEIEKIQQLQILYDMTDRFPVWPFDTTTLRRFATTLTIPVIPIIIGVVSKLVEKALEL
jgi:hypothetical protein